MRIAILGFTKMRYMPYMHFYLDPIDTAKDEVHLIYWDRDKTEDIPAPDGVTAHPFAYEMSDAIPLRKKLPGILKYGRFAEKKVKSLKPDFLILLHSTTALSVYPLLKGKYKNRYIFDYRDVTYEHIPLYKKLVGDVVKNSVLSFTSSEGFRKFLPHTEKLLTSHNISDVSLREDIKALLPRGKHTPIRVGFWGLLRNRETNKALIERLGGDERFELHYYGRARAGMLSMLEEAMKTYDNVFFHGEYSAADRLNMAKNTDIIHNLYDKTDKTSHIAMGNKYYDGPLFSLPQLCTTDSLMGKLCTEYGIGLECDPTESDFADKVYAYYTSLHEEEFLPRCEKELERVLREVEAGNQRIKEALRNA